MRAQCMGKYMKTPPSDPSVDVREMAAMADGLLVHLPHAQTHHELEARTILKVGGTPCSQSPHGRNIRAVQKAGA